MANDFRGLLKNVPEFYGKYKYLNSIYTPSNSVLLQYQIKSLQRATMQQDSGLYKANEYLKHLNPVSYSNDKIEALSVSQIGARILEILNSSFFTSSSSIKSKYLTEMRNGKRDYQNGGKAAMQQEIEKQIQELDMLLKMINYPNAQSVKDNFRRSMNSRSKNKTGFTNYVQYKAQEAEELMMYLLSQDSDFIGVVTGSLYNAGAQLIEDGMLFDKKTFQANNFISYTIDTDKEVKTANSLQDFFNQINRLNAKNHSIHLDNEMYAKLQQLSVLKAQAKSSFSIQELINNTVNRSAIALKDTTPIKVLQDLYYLYTLPQHPLKDNTFSKSLEAYANYSLSRSILQTSLLKNDIYFTRDGFISAADWMEKYKYMLKFKPGVRTMDNKFYAQLRKYNLQPVS